MLQKAIFRIGGGAAASASCPADGEGRGSPRDVDLEPGEISAPDSLSPICGSYCSAVLRQSGSSVMLRDHQFCRPRPSGGFAMARCVRITAEVRWMWALVLFTPLRPRHDCSRPRVSVRSSVRKCMAADLLPQCRQRALAQALLHIDIVEDAAHGKSTRESRRRPHPSDRSDQTPRLRSAADFCQQRLIELLRRSSGFKGYRCLVPFLLTVQVRNPGRRCR